MDPLIRAVPPRFLGVAVRDIAKGFSSPRGIGNKSSQGDRKRTMPPPTLPPCSLFLLLLLLLVSTPTTRASLGETGGTQGESPPLVMVTSSPSAQDTNGEGVDAVTVAPLGISSYDASNSSGSPRPLAWVPQQGDSQVQGDSPIVDIDFLPPTEPPPIQGFTSEGCASPLGLTTGEVLDWQISASSSYPSAWDSGCHARYARLHQPNGRAWCAGRKAAGEWVLVDLGVPAKVTGLLTQGKGDDEEWVESFELSYSLDAYHWHYARDIYNNKKVFQANLDSHRTRHNFVEPPVLGRFLRLHVKSWHSHPSMRFELLGCQECKAAVSEGQHVRMSASSHKPWHRTRSCQPHDASLYSHRAWCARNKDENQWLQWDLGPPHQVTGVVTRGRGDTGRKHWVKAYTLTYSNDTRLWFTYKDGNHLDTKVFGGNLDKHTERRHYLNSPFTARYVRLHPRRWRRSIALRAALLGCPHKGECGPGFFRVTQDSSCVENVAYEGKTWVNDKRHALTGWDYGPSGLAVDGNTDTSLRSCTVVDNQEVDEPVWMVDLGKRKEVRGLVVLTWQGRGQDERTLYRDYVFGLDRLTVYVERERRLERLTDEHRVCASVTRLNNALFRVRMHVECPQPITGRFVYIKAGGVANRWHRVFSLVLCEVMVY